MTYKDLKPSNAKIQVKKIIGFDIETYGDNNLFLLGTCYSTNEKFTFYEKSSMQKYLLMQDDKTYIVASNLQFDFNVLFHGSEYFYDFKPIINGSTMIAMIYEGEGVKQYYVNTEDKEILYRKKQIHFIDSYNYMQGSVEYYGKIIGVSKMEKPKNLGEIPSTQDDWNYLAEYCMRDSEVTCKFMMFLQENYNAIGTTMKLTSASTSMELFKRKYLSRTIKSEEQTINKANDKLFASYYGGRTEIFKRGYYKNMNYLDFNSLYPSCMMNEYPDPNSAKFVHYPSKEIIEYEGIANVRMEIEEMHIPILPVMEKKLLFPTGKIRGTYTHLEIRKAQQEGYVLKQIFWSIYYHKTFEPFKRFVEDMYSKRMEYKNEGNKAEMVFKLLMNSLYGKFAQKNMSEITFMDYSDDVKTKKTIEEFPEGDDISYTFGQDNKGYMIQKKICTSAFVRPIFAIYTTAYGRVKLWDVLNKYDGAYCDTDSIVTRKEVPTSMILGDLKLECKIKRGIFIKPKCYTYLDNNDKQVTKMKGVPRADESTFEKILARKNVEYMKFTKIKESIKGGILPNTKVMMRKFLNLEDNKRIWTQRFNPYEYDEFSEPYNVEVH